MFRSSFCFTIVIISFSILYGAPLGVRAQNPSNFLEDRTCNVNVVPAVPRNLLLLAREGAIDAVWWIPSNRPCSVVYEVTARAVTDQNTTTKTVATRFQVKDPLLTISDLKSGVTYEVSVVAVTSKGQGAPAQATATVPTPTKASNNIRNFINDLTNVNEVLKSTSSTPLWSASAPGTLPGAASIANAAGWTCVPDTSMSMCPAAAARLCNPMECAEVKRRGLCADAFMRATNWETRQVTQYCSRE